jgi:hypothetical protein
MDFASTHYLHRNVDMLLLEKIEINYSDLEVTKFVFQQSQLLTQKVNGKCQPK